MSDEKLVYAYDSFPVSENIAAIIKDLRSRFSQLEASLHNDGGTQSPRYLAVAKTHLETAAMFAIKSLTHTGN